MEKPDILNLLEDKAGLMKYLLDMITSSDKFATNLPLLRERGFSDKGIIDKLTEITTIQSRQIKHLALIALVVSQSDDFDAMLAKMLNKMGRGQEALQAMLRAKMRGAGV